MRAVAAMAVRLRVVGRPIGAQACMDTRWSAAVPIDAADSTAALRAARAVPEGGPFAVELLCARGAAAVADAFAGVRLSRGPATAQALIEATRCALHAEDPLATWLAWITTATGSLPFSPADAVRMELGGWVLDPRALATAHASLLTIPSL